jgi:hypothetical protein
MTINEMKISYTTQEGRKEIAIIDFKKNILHWHYNLTIKLLVARGECLTMINESFINLPSVHNEACYWHNEWARFIYVNLWDMWTNNDEFRLKWRERILGDITNE